MILEVKGDLLRMARTGLVDGLAHGCNCMHAMGSGIAGQLAREFPEVPMVDIRGTNFSDFTKVGTFTYTTVRSHIRTASSTEHAFEVYNCYTQKQPSYDGRDVFEYEAFPALLQKLHRIISANPMISEGYRLGFPQIGAGLAGGDWPRIRQMIVDEFEESEDICAVLVEYQPIA